MKIIVIINFLLGLLFSQAQALNSVSHTYILSPKDNKLLIIDRKSGQELTLEVGYKPHTMILHGSFGYVLNEDSHSVSIIDLKDHRIVKTLPVGQRPRSMIIHKNLGYIINSNLQNISVINLETHTNAPNLPIGERPQSMIIYEEFGFVVNESENCVSIINLQTHDIIKNLPMGRHPYFLVTHLHFAYVMNTNADIISVINLKTQEIINPILVGSWQNHMVIHEDLGYVTLYLSHKVSVIDLKTRKVIQTLSVGEYPSEMVVHGNLGYVMNYGSHDITVIDLEKREVLTTLLNPKSHPIDFSDEYLYLGINKARPLYPTKKLTMTFIQKNKLNDFVPLLPDAFLLGDLSRRHRPTENTVFDTLPLYVVMAEIIPFLSPRDALALLATLKNPGKLMASAEGRLNMMPALYTALFQYLWKGNSLLAKEMIAYFVQLKDPVITPLATYNLVTN